jgi:hypothetical protein
MGVGEGGRVTPYYEALGVSQAQYETMLHFKEVYWNAFTKPGFSALKSRFEAGFEVDEGLKQKSCILHHSMLGSTPPQANAPYVFDIRGRYEAWIPELEKLANS